MDDDLKEKDKTPVDQANHGIDADRYVSLELEGNMSERRAPKAPGTGEPPREIGQRLAWLKRGGASGGGSPYS